MTVRSRAPGRNSGTRDWADVEVSAGQAEEALARAAGHGGRLAAAMEAYPRAPRPWLDLSTGINPDPWWGPRAPMEALCRLPDPQAIARLEATAAEAFGAPPERVVATAGAEAGLRLLPRRLWLYDVDIVSPTYAGHEAAWRAAGTQVRRIGPERLRLSPAQGVLLVNPNNPDGRATPRTALVEIIEARTARRDWTLVDESFVETEPTLSVSDHASDRLVVFRSFGKFYGLAGLRLGFVVAPPDLAAQLRAEQGDWPVSADAIAMGVRAYADVAWRLRTEAELRLRARELDKLLQARGLEVLGGTSLFRLVSVPDAANAFDGLCRAGVLSRPFARREDWLRLGLPRREDLHRLDVALREIVR